MDFQYFLFILFDAILFDPYLFDFTSDEFDWNVNYYYAIEPNIDVSYYRTHAEC